MEIVKQNHWGDPNHLSGDPLFDNLKGDPRLKNYRDAWYRGSRESQITKYQLLHKMPFLEVVEEIETALPINLTILNDQAN